MMNSTCVKLGEAGFDVYMKWWNFLFKKKKIMIKKNVLFSRNVISNNLYLFQKRLCLHLVCVCKTFCIKPVTSLALIITDNNAVFKFLPFTTLCIYSVVYVDR